MAERPTALTKLIWLHQTPEEVVDKLVAEHCLTEDAVAKREETVRVVRDAMARWATKKGPGPTRWFFAVQALTNSGFLNARARVLAVTYEEPLKRPWWKFW